jgi:hypothetical protein
MIVVKFDSINLLKINLLKIHNLAEILVGLFLAPD